jgi:hypothetical protein
VGTAAVLASVLAALTVGAGSAKAGLLGCNYPTAEQSFAPWGDYSKYVPVPGGSFESPGGWTLSNGAKIVAGNEPFHLGDPTDSRSLVLPPGSSALTPGVCLYVLSPTLRFVGSASDGSGVKITMYTRTLFGLVQLPSSGYVELDSVWNPSSTQVFLVQNLLGLVNLAQANIYFRFTPVGGATVQMDDVLLDPYLNF